MSKHKVTIEIDYMPNGLGFEFKLDGLIYAVWPDEDGVRIELQDDEGHDGESENMGSYFARFDESLEDLGTLEHPEAKALHALASLVIKAVRGKTPLKAL